jgi:methylphosphotriester-DNA--protein-cysteine methyltransferase
MASDPALTLQTYRERLPAALLGDHLTCVWVQEVSLESGPYLHRTVPNGSAELVCQVGWMPRIVGPQTAPTEEELAPGSTVVGVRFRPGAVPAALGLPASEILDLDLGADELLGRPATQIGETVASAATAAEAAVALEHAVLDLLREASEPDPVVAEAVRRLLPGHDEEVASLASSLFISERQLRRRCEAAIGLGPKTLQRMVRFQRFLALSQKAEHPSEEIARLAADAGYADQAHLTREAVRLAGRPPRALLLEADHHCRSHHDHDASYAPFLAAA